MDKVCNSKGWRASVTSLRDELVFDLRRPPWSTVITDELPFDKPAGDRFSSELAKAESYLEYGSGATTIAAVRSGCNVVSVESDLEFLQAIEDLCSDIYVEESASQGTPLHHLIHADIGHTGPWGLPTLRWHPKARAQRWSAYPEAPWYLLGRGFRADTILVDGRFRVACALQTIMMQEDTDWTLLFDDYTNRNAYWEIEQFAELSELCGRMAVFKPLKGVDLEKCSLAYKRFSNDWR